MVIVKSVAILVSKVGNLTWKRIIARRKQTKIAGFRLQSSSRGKERCKNGDQVSVEGESNRGHAAVRRLPLFALGVTFLLAFSGMGFVDTRYPNMATTIPFPDTRRPDCTGMRWLGNDLVFWLRCPRDVAAGHDHAGMGWTATTQTWQAWKTGGTGGRQGCTYADESDLKVLFHVVSILLGKSFATTRTIHRCGKVVKSGAKNAPV